MGGRRRGDCISRKAALLVNNNLRIGLLRRRPPPEQGRRAVTAGMTSQSKLISDPRRAFRVHPNGRKASSRPYTIQDSRTNSNDHAADPNSLQAHHCFRGGQGPTRHSSPAEDRQLRIRTIMYQSYGTHGTTVLNAYATAHVLSAGRCLERNTYSSQ